MFWFLQEKKRVVHSKHVPSSYSDIRKEIHNVMIWCVYSNWIHTYQVGWTAVPYLSIAYSYSENKKVNKDGKTRRCLESPLQLLLGLCSPVVSRSHTKAVYSSKITFLIFFFIFQLKLKFFLFSEFILGTPRYFVFYIYILASDKRKTGNRYRDNNNNINSGWVQYLY